MVRLFLAGLALAVPAALFAQAAPKAPAAQPVTLVIESYIARETVDAKGVKSKGLFPTDRALPGEAIVYILKYANVGKVPLPMFVDNNVPDGVEFTGVAEAWASVSIDGGKTFGPLSSFKVKKQDGTFRAAIPRDVTSVRWKPAQPVAPGANGRFVYYGLVK